MSSTPDVIFLTPRFDLRRIVYTECKDMRMGPGQCSRYSDSLRDGQSADQIAVDARFSAPVQIGHGAHPASYTMGTGSLPRVKRPGRGVNLPPTTSAPSGPS